MRFLSVEKVDPGNCENKDFRPSKIKSSKFIFDEGVSPLSVDDDDADISSDNDDYDPAENEAWLLDGALESGSLLLQPLPLEEHEVVLVVLVREIIMQKRIISSVFSILLNFKLSRTLHHI